MDTFAALSAFIAVIERGGFAAAGRQMGLATSSVTRQVDALEQSLGVRLLNRSTRSVTLTGAGEDYFEHAVRIINDLESANLEVSEALGPPRGRLRVSLPMAFARLHVAPAIAAFKRQYPGIALDLMLSDEVADLVEQRLDIAIRLGKVDSPNVVARTLAAHHRCVCASHEYLAEHGEPLTPADLKAHDCLTFSYSRVGATWHFSGRSQEIVRVSGSLKANSSEVLREAALAGVGIILMPNWLVGADVEAGRLRVLLSDWTAGVDAGEGGIHAVYLPNRRNSKKVRAFIDFFAAHFGAPPYWDRRVAPDLALRQVQSAPCRKR